MFVPAFGLLIANPLAGAILVDAIPEVFWRFFFMLPVPLCFGLLVAGLIQVLPSVLRSRSAVLSAAAVAAAVAVFVATVSTVTFSPANVGFAWKPPTGWKLDEATVASLGPSLSSLSGKTVLADESVAVTLALMDPTVKVVAQRSQNTLTAFSVLGDRATGDRRVRAQAVAGGLTDSPIYVRDFSRVLRDDADAVVVRTSVLWLIDPLLAKSGKEWRRAGGDSLLTVYVSGAGT